VTIGLRCPDRPTLEKMLLGRLTGAEAEHWEEHLSGCAPCAEALDGLEKEAPVSGLLRPANLRGSDPGDPVVEELIGRLKRLLPAVVPPGPHAPGELARLAQYRLLEKIGEGGMGVVYRAEDTRLHRLVALKVLHPRLLADEDQRRRFLQEARAAAAVEHERIVPIYEVNEDQGVPFFIMQLLQGEALETRLRRHPGPHPAAEIVRLGRQIAEGLEAAHARGLVHRDIKPANVWLEAPAGEAEAPATGGRVRLLDFGLARVARGDTRLTASGLIVGTPGFLSPEQAAGRPVDQRSDLFSLGVVLYLLATGRLPFNGPDLMAQLTALAVEPPRSPFEHNPDLPEALAHLIVRLLSKKPGARPRSAREVIDVLDVIEKGLHGAAPDAPCRRATNGALTEVLDTPGAARYPERAARRGRPGRWLVLAGGAAAVVLALVLVAVLGRAPGRDGPADAGEAGKTSGPARPASRAERFADEVDPDSDEPPPGWTILFRSDDPGIWNTVSLDRKNFAVPVRRAHRAIRHVRLKRMDTGDYLILPISREQLDRDPRPMPETGHAWSGTVRLAYNARTLGIAQGPRHRWPNHRGVLAVAGEGWDAFSGSGFCNKCQFNDGQHYCWQTREIPKTAFEIAVSADPLSAEEQRRLLK
jgi:serine/threonine protein kinase